MIPSEDQHDKAQPKTQSETIAALQRAMLTGLKESKQGTSDLARRRVTIPPHINPSITGVAIAGLAREGQIEQVGTTVTDRSVAHGRLTRIWKLADPKTGQDASNGGPGR